MQLCWQPTNNCWVKVVGNLRLMIENLQKVWINQILTIVINSIRLTNLLLIVWSLNLPELP